MTVNIPRMLDDHASGTVEELDRDIQATADRLVQLAHERAIVVTHQQVHEAFLRLLLVSASDRVTSARD